MTEANNQQPNKKTTKGQMMRSILRRMGQPTPEEQVREFQQRYLANWMKKQGKGSSMPPSQPSSDEADES